jgi:chromosome segregation ATPase
MRVETKPEPKPELKPETKIVTKVETTQETKTPSNGAGDFAKQLEAERHERRRLEARVLSLNDQLQTVHAQLKASLESENIYQKRLFECEEGLRKAEEIKAASESAVNEEKQQRERIEEEFAKFKSTFGKAGEDRKAWQEEWLSKLASALTVLQESDGRLAREIEKRRELQQALRGLHEDFCAEADKEIDGASVAEAVHA